MYLGRLLNIHNTADMHDVELNNRIAGSWRKFWAQKHELTSSNFALKSRLELFDSTISPSLPSFLLEPWMDWIQRATHIAEDYASRYGVTDWASAHFSRKFRLAGRIGRRMDSRWSKKVLYWVPEGATRQRGHPHKRWSDALDDFFKAAHQMEPGEWLNLCVDRNAWASLSSVFVKFCFTTQ